MQFGTSGSAYVYSANFTKTPVSKSGYCDRLIVKYKIDIENASVAYGTDNLDGCFEDNSKRLKVGDKIQVLYLKSLPAYNSVVKPVGIINNDRLIQLIVGVFILLSLLAILMLRNKKLKENEVVYTIYSVSFLVGVVSMLYGIADILCWFLI